MSDKRSESILRGRGPLHSDEEREDNDAPNHNKALLTAFDGAVATSEGKASSSQLHRRGSKHHHHSTTTTTSTLLLFFHELKLRWRLLSGYGRVATALVLFLVAQHVLLGILDWVYARPQDWPLQSTERQYAVVINTYKRPDMLRQAVQHYAQTCGKAQGVAQVFVIWAELDATPPTPEALLVTRQRRRQMSDASVEIIRVSKDSLNSRFLPIASAQSTAIFMVDDDVRVDCRSLHTGFEAWKRNPNAMVGYYPRLAIESSSSSSSSSSSGYVYQAWPGVYWRQAANFILTKACFIHAKYLDVYSDPARHPTAILDYVDKYKNCEDVAMSLLVANQTATTTTTITTTTTTSKQTVPNIMYVEGHISDKGLTGGISSSGKTQHFAHRSDCLRDMTEMYAAHGWPAPLREKMGLKDITYTRHVTAWQIRPSNFFEWFALSNPFKS
mmetsp:Transcript_7685/g.15428  ORF Transcript_7685/g.15428 Transcript_7685/m.15428 type:complete len:443 (-) Transcript_7685:175-1503(-)